MDNNNQQIKALVGKDLACFKVIEMTEVYRVDVDGRKSSSVGFFKNPDIAKAFAGGQIDASYHKTGEAMVLTDGIVGFVIVNQNPVKLFDEEAEVLVIKEKALGRLSPEERKILGY